MYSSYPILKRFRNTIGYIYWLSRFLWQCIFYLLVVVSVIMQVYYQDTWMSLMWVFVAIAVMGAVFLWLEILQAVHNWSQYAGYVISPLYCRAHFWFWFMCWQYLFNRSPYNIVDIFVYALSLAGSVCQIYNIATLDPNGDMATLSFSVPFVFLHFVRLKWSWLGYQCTLAVLTRVLTLPLSFHSCASSGYTRACATLSRLLSASWAESKCSPWYLWLELWLSQLPSCICSAAAPSVIAESKSSHHLRITFSCHSQLHSSSW